MKNTIWNKRIPTFLGIGVLVASIFVTSVLVKNGVLFTSRAGPTDNPENIRISNISDSSFTVSYSTQADVIGSITFGKDKNLGQTALDERDEKSDTVTNHKIHSVTVKNLTPSTKYFFNIISSQNTFSNNGIPFDLSTGPIIQTPPSGQEPITGKILLPSGSKPNEGVVYVTTDNSQVISTLVRQDGNYILPLNSMRGSDLASYFNFNSSTNLKILVISNSLRSNVLISKDQISPVPQVTLSNDYDFTVANTPIASSSASPGFPSFTANSLLPLKDPQILTPKKDQGFTDQQPQFTGITQPNEKVEIIIHSDENIQVKITADSNGNWKFRPGTPLSPGQHTVSITTKDSFGILKTITQSFVVYASGSQVSQSATPSATPTIIISPAPSQISSSAALSLTPTVILFPSPTPTSIILVSPPQTKNIPPTGNSSILIGGIFGIATTVFGALLLLLSRGGI